MSRERGVPFSDELALKNERGEKGETRRICNPQPWHHDEAIGKMVVGSGSHRWISVEVFNERGGGGACRLAAPYGRPGDTFYQRQTFAFAHAWDRTPPRDVPANARWFFRADAPFVTPVVIGKWRPPMFMPKSRASEHRFKILGITIERVQDITPAGAIAEGIDRIGGPLSCTPWRNYSLGPNEPFAKNCASPVRSYHTLWDQINGKRPGCDWLSNPWVFRYRYERVNYGGDCE